MTVQDLRDVLREQAESPSPANPYRHDEVRSRIRRTSLRRRVTSGAAAVAVVAAGIYLIPGTATVPDRDRTATAAARPGRETTAEPAGLPESFTSADGTAYRRLATAMLKAEGVRKVSLKVPVSGKPIDVAGLCDGEFSDSAPRVAVNGVRTGSGPDFGACHKRTQLRPLVVPANATEVTVTFDMTRSGSGGCPRKIKNCEPRTYEDTDWRVAVYEWTPPAQPVEPAPVKAFPTRAGGMQLARSATGVWPQDASFTLTVRSKNGKIGIDQLCTGDLASRMWFQFRIDGELSSSVSNCGVWQEGKPYPMAMALIPVPKGKQVTISGKMSLWGEYTNRPVRWSVGVFVK
ncbi:hypothetical protein [Nonomuraea sp. NPDC049784]|uniref:hypothetical protein n=1 Tax=Nonomuraea sp. NPDC049784 TaxID=3154361 RepID=UPI0033CB44CB